MNHDFRLRAIRKKNPDLRKLARALLALVEHQATDKTDRRRRKREVEP